MAELPRAKRLQVEAVFQAERGREHAAQAARQRPEGRDKGTSPAVAGVSVWVEAYEAPTGSGFVVYGEVEHGGSTFVRTDDAGPAGQTQDWTEAAEPAGTPP